MCGFVGILTHKSETLSRTTLTAMTRMIAHRGPDGEGIYKNRIAGFGHRRLAVIDLSEAAAQPMESDDRRYVLVYNGELFNFKSLRRELISLGHTFSTRSDTEVVLKALIQWDYNALEKFNGMFSFMFLDNNKKRVIVARDRYGIKPLYMAMTAEGFLFGSEIKSFLKHPAFSVEVNLNALDEYFTFQNILGTETLFKGVHHLPPGHFHVIKYRGRDGGWKKEPAVRFWDFRFEPDDEIKDPQEAARHLQSLLKQAVKRQMVSDVPLGSYLSGGIDSGSIVAVASDTVDRLTTFTGGFDLSSAQGMESGYDERAAAEILSNQFKTEHYEMVLHAGDMAHIMPKLIWHLEELRLGQCYPNYFLARLASKFVKVVLCGAGGDELFAGYPWRYFGSSNCSENGAFLKNYYSFWQRLVSDENKVRLFNKETRKEIRPNRSFHAFQWMLAPHHNGCNGIETNINRSLYFEAKSFLHGLLMIEDKLSMAHGLETRVPFLDNDLVDFACRVPVAMKLKNILDIPRIDENELGKAFRYQFKSNDGKHILRQAIYPMVPREVSERAKQGFSSPDVSWYRGESLDYVKNLLTNNSPCIYEYLERRYVETVLDDHLSGRKNHRLLIWSFLCFEWWLRIFFRGDGLDPGFHSGTM